MTAKQRQARAKFKAVVKEAAKLRKKNPKLTQAEAVKQAWAILYSKERKGKKIGYSKEREKLHKNATAWLKKRKKVDEDKTKKERVSIAYQRAPFGRPGVGAIKKKSATKVKAKKGKSTEMHTDTKSHNVNIRVISGINSNTIQEIKRINELLERWQRILFNLENQKKLEKNFTNKKLLSREIMKVKNVIKDLKKNISNLKKHIK